MYNTLFEHYIDQLNIDNDIKSAVKELRHICLEAYNKHSYPKRDKKEVEEVQKFLNTKGFSLTVDGIIGPKTTYAIQKFSKIDTDRIFGPITTQAYNNILTTLSLPNIETHTKTTQKPYKPQQIQRPAPITQERPLVEPVHEPIKQSTPTPNKYLTTYMPGQTVPSNALTNEAISSLFTVLPIPDDIFKIMQGKSYKGGAPSRNQLRYIRCLHKDASGNTIVGELVSNAQIANKLLTILKKLYQANYPIQRMRLVDYYGGNDTASMNANNTSCFNFRFISGTQKISKHGQGIAIDINPLYNPCVSKNGTKIEPESGRPYANRANGSPYQIKQGDACYQAFTNAGFKWGGDWRSIKDYQHFEI